MTRQGLYRDPGHYAPFLSQRSMTGVIGVCLMALSTNAVLIQTITSDDSVLKNGVRVGVLLLAVFAMSLRRVMVPVGIFLMVLYSIVLVAVRQNPDQLSFIFIFVLALALFLVDERSLEKLLVMSSLAALLLVFVFLGLGITENTVQEFRNRMTFGTNGVPFFFNLVYGAFAMLLFYVHKHKLKRRSFLTLVTVGLSGYLFQLTDARGGFASLLLFVGLLYIVPALGRLGAFRVTTAFLPVIFLILAFFIAAQSQDVFIDKLLSYRPSLFRVFFESVDAGDVLLSSTVKQFGTVDSSYIHLLIGGGAILCVVFFFIFARAVFYLFSQKRFAELSFLIATCVYFNSESIMLRIENVFVIFFWYLILRYSSSWGRKSDATDPVKRVQSQPLPS